MSLDGDFTFIVDHMSPDEQFNMSGGLAGGELIRIESVVYRRGICSRLSAI